MTPRRSAGPAPRPPNGSPGSESRRSGRTTAPAPTRRSRTPGDGRLTAAGGDAEHRSREHVGRPDRLPPCRAGILLGVRGTCPSLGARLIGGCCGTTPTEIGAIRGAIEEERAPRAPLAVRRARARRRGRARGARDAARRRSARGPLGTSIQIDPPLGANYAGLLEIAAAVRGRGAGAYVDINDNATARVGMNPLIVAAAIERTVGIETIPHLTPRDTTIMGLESVLLGAHAEGVRNLLAVTGDPPEVGDYPGRAASTRSTRSGSRT